MHRPHNHVLGIWARNKNSIKVTNSKAAQKQSSSSLTRKSSSVRNHRGRKYVANEELEARQKYFGSTKIHNGNLSGYVYKDTNLKNHGSNNTSVSKAINYYSQMLNLFPRSKTNSRKRGTFMVRGKDSRNVQQNNDTVNTRANKNSIKRTPLSYNTNANRNNLQKTKSNNRSNLKERIKTIEYNDNSFSTLAGRSNTVQKRK